MANLSERLRTSLEQMATSCSVGMGIWDKHSNAVLEAASALDRLTVEGLAGVISKNLPGVLISTPRIEKLSAAILDYITTPSVEETHD